MEYFCHIFVWLYNKSKRFFCGNRQLNFYWTWNMLFESYPVLSSLCLGLINPFFVIHSLSVSFSFCFSHYSLRSLWEQVSRGLQALVPCTQHVHVRHSKAGNPSPPRSDCLHVDQTCKEHLGNSSFLCCYWPEPRICASAVGSWTHWAHH